MVISGRPIFIRIIDGLPIPSMVYCSTKNFISP